MNIPHIALVSAEIPLEELSRLAATIQVQIMRDFAPFWNIGAVVSAAPNIASVEAGAAPIFISRNFSGPERGFHTNPSGHLPTAYVLLDELFTVTTSHEALEMLADPNCHRPFVGPSIDPAHEGEQVTYVVEVCDPVQGEPYLMENGALVADFVTPAYYAGASSNGPLAHHAPLPGPLSVPPNGYLTYFDSTNQWYQARNNGVSVQFIKGPIGVPPPNVCAREFAHSIDEFQDRPRVTATPELLEKHRRHAQGNASARQAQAQRLLAGSDVLRAWHALQADSDDAPVGTRKVKKRK